MGVDCVSSRLNPGDALAGGTASQNRWGIRSASGQEARGLNASPYWDADGDHHATSPDPYDTTRARRPVHPTPAAHQPCVGK